MGLMRVPFKMLAAPAAPFQLSSGNTLLLLVDFQQYTTTRTAGFGKMASKRGIDREFDEYFTQVDAAIQNAARLLEACRQEQIPIVHTLLACTIPDRRDLSRQFSSNRFDIPCGDLAGEIRSELAPLPGERILPRTTYSPFPGTSILTELQNRAVETILLAGMMANITLEMTAREAADRNFGVVFVPDSSASETHAWHEQLRDSIVGGLIRQRSTSQVIEMLRGERS